MFYSFPDTAKPYVDKKNEKFEKLRYVDHQPLCHDPEKSHYNKRKLMRLPYHLMHSTDKDNLSSLKTDALCSYPFLLAKLKGCGYRCV